ncbi:MAG: hypothetical protein KDB53_01820 [Planctomycetes bacterium]|nr:hypothetical protein [Planctomycetota bacterium]
MNDAVQAQLDRVVHADRARLLASLIRRAGDFELAEDALQEALVRAATRWPDQGVPDDPAAWLARTAWNVLVDEERRAARDRSARTARFKEARIPGTGATDLTMMPADPLEDDRLRLLFTCCHPALAREARIALTLNALLGLTAAEIARAYLITEASAAQRLVRAKRRIREAGIPYRVPAAEDLHERLDAVLAVIYLVFNEGHVASRGDDLQRPDLGSEANRLAEALSELMPQEPEVAGLLALLRFQHARRNARVDAMGRFVRLEDQDRRHWDQALIACADQGLRRALARGRPGVYQLQAAIAGVHATAASYDDTDWPQILGLYDHLLALTESPVVALNRSVALAEVEGADAALKSIRDTELATVLDGYPYFHATLGDLEARRGNSSCARQHFLAAAERTTNPVERAYLLGRASVTE